MYEIRQYKDRTWSAIRFSPADAVYGFATAPEAIVYAETQESGLTYDDINAAGAFFPLRVELVKDQGQARNPIAPLGWESLIPFPNGIPPLLTSTHVPISDRDTLLRVMADALGDLKGFKFTLTASPDFTDTITSPGHTYTIDGDSSNSLMYRYLTEEEEADPDFVSYIPTFRREGTKPKADAIRPEEFDAQQFEFPSDDDKFWHNGLSKALERFYLITGDYLTYSQKKIDGASVGDPFIFTGGEFARPGSSAYQDNYAGTPWAQVSPGLFIDFRRIGDAICLFIDITFGWGLGTLGLHSGGASPPQAYMLYRIYSEVTGWTPDLTAPTFTPADGYTVSLDVQTGGGPTIFGIPTKFWCYSYQIEKTGYRYKWTPSVTFAEI